MEKKSDFLEDYKTFMAEAIKVGRKVYPTDGIVTKIQNNLEKHDGNPEYLFSSMEGALSDEIYNVQKNLKELREPKKLSIAEKVGNILKTRKPEKVDEKTELNKQVPDLTKLTYLSTIMLETIASRQKQIIGALPGEIIFFKVEYPSILNDLDEAVKKGAEFDLEVINEISRISNKETFNWLKDQWG